jgi:TPR repeat protein
MAEYGNLPAKLAAQGLTATAEKRGSLVGRGMAAVLSNNQQVMRKSDDAIYRQARDVYNRLADDGLGAWFGFEERKQPLTEALNTFFQLARESYGKAYFPLSTLYGGEQSVKGDTAQAERFHKLAFDWLHASQYLNDPEIWHDLGALYVGNDADLAIYWFLKAAAAGNARSMWGLVGAYEYREDYENALYWQIKAAIAGHEEAQRGLEMQHEHGDLEEKIGDEQVFGWYVWSAEHGHVWVQLFLAEAYCSGDVIEQDDERAAHWYLQAAIQGEPHAQLQIGKMYWEGRGVERHDEQARYWLEQSAEQGDPAAQYDFGQFLSQQGGEVENAVQMIESAADQGYGPAQYLIASDEGATFDVSEEQCAELFDKALTWYEDRAEFGDSQLRLDLALMHLDCWQASYDTSHRTSCFEGLRLLEEVASEPLAIDFDTGEPSPKNDVQRRASRRLGSEYLRGKVIGHVTE